jgi:regulator of sigma E protease
MSLLLPVWTIAEYILPFVFVLNLLIFFHELGHFLVGRWCGVKVDAFSLGFGPRIFGFNDRRGTHWQLAAFPLGGYVKFRGDTNPASLNNTAGAAPMPPHERAVSFFAQKVWKRAAIVAAGPAANFLLAIAILTGVFYLNGRAILSPVAESITAGSAAEAAGVRPDDLIVAAGGTKLDSFEEMQRIVQAAGSRELAITVNRGGRLVDLAMIPKWCKAGSPCGTSLPGLPGATVKNKPEYWHIRHFDFIGSFNLAVSETWNAVAETAGYFKELVTGAESSIELAGPIRIAEVSGEIAKSGLGPLLTLAAMLSISVGLVNLLPVPLLDGGHLFYYSLEAIRGKALNERVQRFGFKIGFAFVTCLLFVATYNDVLHLSRQWTH